MSATQGAPAQRVPAWKRLGLKLKGAASDGSPASHPAHANQVAAIQRPNSSSFAASAAAPPPSSFNKRKQIPSASYYPTPDQGASKRFRRDEHQTSLLPSSPALRKQKSVSFTDDTKRPDEPAKVAEKKKKKPKKAKSASKSNARTTPEAGFSLEPALAYLRQWKSSRENWKFNKNHQTLLIKYVFDPQSIPSSDISTFYAYIRDLKGFVRARLRETAEEIRKKDMEQGAEGFPAKVEDKAGKQRQYEEIVGKLLEQQRGNGGSGSFDEADVVMRTADDDVKQRVLKRMRAEMVVDELSDSGESSTTTGTSGTTGGETSSQEAGDNATEKRVKLNDGSQRSIKRKRKLRTADDDSSSSESESDSDSDEDSSSSSSSGDSDDEMDMAPAQGQLETSSSSSSSSSGSDSESGSESGTGEEESDAEESDSESD